MTGKKSMLMLVMILLVSLGTMIFIGGTEPKIPQRQLQTQGLDFNVPPPEAIWKKAELRISVNLSDEEFRVLQKRNEQFAEKYPQLNIQMYNASTTSHADHLLREAKEGTAADILQLDNEWIGEFAARGHLQPLDDIYRGEVQSEYLPQVLAQMKWNNYFWAVPKAVDPYVMIYHKQAWNETGIPLPISDWDALNKLFSDGESEVVESTTPRFYLDPNDPYALISLLSLLDAGGERLAELVDQQGISLEPLHWLSSVESPYSQLKEGRMLAIIGKYSDYRAYGDFRLGILPLLSPMGSPMTLGASDGHGMLSGSSYAVFAGSELKKEATEWIRFMTDETVQYELYSQGGGLPPRTDLLRSASFANLVHLQELSAALKKGRVFSGDPNTRTRLQLYSEQIAEWIAQEQVWSTYRQDWLQWLQPAQL